MFIDYPGRVIFDIGYLDKNELVITVCSGNFTAYVVSPAMDGADGSDNHLYSIVRQFRHIIVERAMYRRDGHSDTSSAVGAI